MARAVLDDAGALGRVNLTVALQHEALRPVQVQSRVW